MLFTCVIPEERWVNPKLDLVFFIYKIKPFVLVYNILVILLLIRASHPFEMQFLYQFEVLDGITNLYQIFQTDKIHLVDYLYITNLMTYLIISIFLY